MGITEVYPCGCNSFVKHSSDVDLVDCDALCPPVEPKPTPGNMLTCSSKRGSKRFITQQMLAYNQKASSTVNMNYIALRKFLVLFALAPLVSWYALQVSVR